MLLNILDEFVVDEGNAFKDEGEDAIFESIVKDMSPFEPTSNRKDWRHFVKIFASGVWWEVTISFASFGWHLLVE